MAHAPQPTRTATPPKPSVWEQLRRARQSREPRTDLEALLIVQQQTRYSQAARTYLDYGLVYEGENIVGVTNLAENTVYRLDGAGVCTCDDLLRQKLNEALTLAGSPLRLACKHVAIRATLVQHFEKHGGGRWREKSATAPTKGEALLVLLPSGRTVTVAVADVSERGDVLLAKEGTAEWFPLSGLHFDGQVWTFTDSLLARPGARRDAFFNHLERKARREGGSRP